MKYLLLILTTGFINSSFSQLVDSIAIKQVDSLIRVSRDLTAGWNFEEALEVNAAAEQIALIKLGEQSASFGSCAFNRGRVNHFKGNNQEAEIWYLKAKAIREKIIGKEHADYAACLMNLAVLYNDIGNYEKAEPLHLEAKAIQEKILGKEHPHYVGSLNNLANLYYLMGNYEKAEPLHREAKAIREKTLGKEHPDYATSLNNLAALYFVMSSYEKAEPLYLETKVIRGKALGYEHPDYAYILNNLAILYNNMGYYEKAEPLYLKAKEIYENLHGKEHPFYAANLMNLAAFYSGIGNYEKAESLYIESKDIYEKVFGKEHPDYAFSLSNLAGSFSRKGYYEKAEPLYLNVSSILEKALGKEHSDYARSLEHMADMYRRKGDYNKAITINIEARDIRERVLGKEHFDYAESLINLANLYCNIGNFEKAEPFYLESKAIYEKVLSKEHPKYVPILINLAGIYEIQNQYSASELLLKESFPLFQEALLRASCFLTEHELAKYFDTFQNIGNNLAAYLLARVTMDGQQGNLPSLVADQLLFYKGFLLIAASRLNSPILNSPESMDINLRLKSYRRRLAAEYAKPIADKESISALEEKANTAEKVLVNSVAGYADDIRQVKWQAVQSRLKQSEAAIEFVHFKVNFPATTDSTMYAALLILSGMEQPKFIPLFEEKELEHLVQYNIDRKADYVNDLYSLADRGLIKQGTDGRSLYELIWKPLEADLSEVKTIYFSPSGLLHRINIDAIPVSETETIADKYQLIALSSTRQIVIPTTLDNTNNDAVLFGGIQFEQDSTILNNEPLLVSRSRGELSFKSIDSTLRGGTWHYLAGTEREVKAIEKIMQASGINSSLKRGYDASEESFKNIGIDSAPSPRVLHIATHGYFFPDPKSIATGTGLGGEQESVFKISDHPMLRSGLILAGGNAAWQGNQTLEGKEDGILTAYEISQMNLSNTELVVLSACETGLGEIQGNEGVYGLQRAFKIAGAKYLIMSLWQVPDKQTSLLMTTFYRKWLEEKMTIPVAFHAAQKELRDLGLDPYHWAGFVLVE